MNLKGDLRWLILIAVAALAIFANTLGGDFVYDDNRQIAANPLIQNPELYGKALISDVWAFKGDGTLAASNYWRPTFTAWCILNFRLFGLDPFGWHLLNVLLHVGVCLLVFSLLRRWQFSSGLAFCISLIFAVHPVHTESVAWISGSPDLLLAAAMLGSFLCADRWCIDGRSVVMLAASLILYALALGSKETAIMFVPVYYLIFARRESLESGKAGSLRAALPFALVAAIYFVIRWLVIGTITHPVEDSAGSISALQTISLAAVFYLRQIVFPFELGENYWLRPVEAIGFYNFVLPAIICFLSLSALWLMERGSHIRKIGLAILVLPMLPVLNISTFPSDQIVHDRYLYLPLLGFLMIVVPFIADRVLGERSTIALTAATGLIAICLGIQTISYNQVWKSNLSLWSHNVRIDPSSRSSLTNYGAELSAQGRYQEAVAAYDRSIADKPTALALMGRARNYIALNRLDDAIRDLNAVLVISAENINAYTLYQSYEAIALAYQQAGRLSEAENALREAIRRLPIYRAALTEKLAVVLYLQGRKPDVLRELEGARDQARVELLPGSKLVMFRLGMLYAEFGKNAEAKAAFKEFLDATSATGNTVMPERTQATGYLRNLP
jgi:hypothetical protein